MIDHGHWVDWEYLPDDYNNYGINNKGKPIFAGKEVLNNYQGGSEYRVETVNTSYQGSDGKYYSYRLWCDGKVVVLCRTLFEARKAMSKVIAGQKPIDIFDELLEAALF